MLPTSKNRGTLQGRRRVPQVKPSKTVSVHFTLTSWLAVVMAVFAGAVVLPVLIYYLFFRELVKILSQ